MTRDIAQKFNTDFAASIAALGHGDAIFTLPEPLIIQGRATRIMSLRDGSKKMSKSEESDMTRINLADDADTIAQKIRKARTDPEPLPSEPAGLEDRPEARNLVGIYAALSDRTVEETLAEHGGAQFSAFKQALTDLMVETVTPIGEETARLLTDTGHIDAVLADGAARARTVAEPILRQVKDIVGFVQG